MNREEVQTYIAQTYDANAEYLWAKYPHYAVFRHPNNQKWFAAVLDVPKQRLGLPEEGILDILNVKCDPVAMGSFLSQPGIFKGYHMNKANWLSLALDGTVDKETIALLLDMSFDLTAKQAKARKGKNQTR